MIKLTRLNSQQIIVNADLIESIEVRPNETILSLTTGNKIVVKESSEEIVNKIIEYKGKVVAEAELEKENRFNKLGKK
jgi:flagellar protein FlbD